MKLGIRRIKKALSECAFDPSSPGPMKVIVDAKNPWYYQQRAMEFIREAESASESNYDDCIIRAIQLLILAKETKSK